MSWIGMGDRCSMTPSLPVIDRTGRILEPPHKPFERAFNASASGRTTLIGLAKERRCVVQDGGEPAEGGGERHYNARVAPTGIRDATD